MALNHVTKVIKGVSHVYIADIAPITADTEWLEVFVTVENSLKITQADHTKTEGKIDQKAGALYYTYESNPLVCEFMVPDMALEVLQVLCNWSTPAYVPSGYNALGIATDVKELRKMVKIEHENGDATIITYGSLISTFNMDSPKTKAAEFKVIVSAMAPDGTGEAEPVIIYNKTTTPATLYKWVKYGTSAAGAGLTDTFTNGVTTYIGIAEGKYTAVESTDPADYKWTAIGG